MPKRAKTPGSGRKPGSLNKATVDIRAIAQEHGSAMIDNLIHLARHAESEAVRATCTQALLDRGYGKPQQPVTGADGGNLVIRIMKPE